MLIDFHTHAFPDSLANRALSSLAANIHLEPYTNGTVDDLIRKMDEWRVDCAVICNIATNPKQTLNVNNFAIETLKAHGDRVVPLGSVHPAFEDPVSEIERLHDAGIVGLKIHPDYMSVMIDDPSFDVIFETASRYDMFIITHAGFDVYSPNKIFAPPEAIYNRLNRSPDTKLICAHFGGFTLWDDVEKLLIGKNVYIDVSLGALGRLDKEQAARMILAHDPDKLLFATDCPWASVPETFDYIDSLAIPSELKEKIYYKNALRLLGK